MTDDTRRLRMTAEQLAVLADDIADMSQEFIDARDANSLRNMATNLAGMIRLHVQDAALEAVAVTQELKPNANFKQVKDWIKKD